MTSLDFTSEAFRSPWPMPHVDRGRLRRRGRREHHSLAAAIGRLQRRARPARHRLYRRDLTQVRQSVDHPRCVRGGRATGAAQDHGGHDRLGAPAGRSQAPEQEFLQVDTTTSCCGALNVSTSKSAVCVLDRQDGAVTLQTTVQTDATATFAALKSYVGHLHLADQRRVSCHRGCFANYYRSAGPWSCSRPATLQRRCRRSATTPAKAMLADWSSWFAWVGSGRRLYAKRKGVIGG
jgi:hypothetical protein